MLFSNDQVAQFINLNFEATWEMVREVPIIRIDFGNGNVLTRTLHGNILTSVCTADGKTLDALPGIYNPQGYLDQLDQFRLLAQNFQKVKVNAREQWVRQYHANAVAAIQANQPPARFIETKVIAPVGKGRIEKPTEALLAYQKATDCTRSPPLEVAAPPERPGPDRTPADRQGHHRKAYRSHARAPGAGSPTERAADSGRA